MSTTKPRDLCDRTFLFACDVVRFCLVFSSQPGARQHIAEQLLEAATSVGANAEEARAAYSRREFACKNSLVLKEAREARFWLRLIAATQLAPAATVDPLLAEANELVGIYTATVRKAKEPLES